MKKNGVSSNYSYPYSSHVEGDLFYCRRDRIFNSSIFRIKDYVSIRAGSCLFIKVKLQEFPISVGI